MELKNETNDFSPGTVVYYYKDKRRGIVQKRPGDIKDLSLVLVLLDGESIQSIIDKEFLSIEK